MRLAQLLQFGILTSSLYACSNSASNTGSSFGEPLSGDHARLVGRWITTCIDVGGGDSAKLIPDVRFDGYLAQVYKYYEGTSDCSGSFTYVSPNDGSPTTQFVHTENLSAIEIPDIPAGFVVASGYNIEDETTSYVVFYVANDNELHLISDIGTDYGDVWANWEAAVPDLPAFVADPTNIGNPSAIHLTPTTESP